MQEALRSDNNPYDGPQRCPCGLSRKELLSLKDWCVGNGGICTAIRRGSKTEICGELVANHVDEMKTPTDMPPMAGSKRGLLAMDDACIVPALIIAAGASCRTSLESYGKTFVKRHKRVRAMCSHTFGTEPTTADIFRHYEICPAVRKNSAELIHSKNPDNEAEQSCLHAADLLTMADGAVLVPFNLEPPVKRFWVNCLVSKGYSVGIVDHGGVRHRRSDEISPYLPIENV